MGERRCHDAARPHRTGRCAVHRGVRGDLLSRFAPSSRADARSVPSRVVPHSWRARSAVRDDREPRAFDEGGRPKPARLRNDDRRSARSRTAAVGAVRVGTQGRAAGVARRRRGRCRTRGRARRHDLAWQVGRGDENERDPTSVLTRMSPGSRNHLDGVAGSSGALLRRAQDARSKFIMPTQRLVDKASHASRRVRRHSEGADAVPIVSSATGPQFLKAVAQALSACAGERRSAALAGTEFRRGASASTTATALNAANFHASRSARRLGQTFGGKSLAAAGG